MYKYRNSEIQISTIQIIQNPTIFIPVSSKVSVKIFICNSGVAVLGSLETNGKQLAGHGMATQFGPLHAILPLHQHNTNTYLQLMQSSDIYRMYQKSVILVQIFKTRKKAPLFSRPCGQRALHYITMHYGWATYLPYLVFQLLSYYGPIINCTYQIRISG